MDYLKTNHLSLLIILYMVATSVFGGSGMLGALDRTTVGNPWTFSGAVTFSSTVTNSGAVTNSSTVANNGTVTNNAGTLYSYTNSTTTTATAQTLKVSDVQGYDTVILTPNVASDTVTFFASSTASTWLPAAGDSQRTCFINGTTTAGVNLTFAGGTGTTLLVASSSATALGSLVIGPQKKGCFDFTRGNSTATTFDIIASFVSFL